MKVILFGNRGSVPLGASENSPFGKYGGDTTCVGVTFDDGTLVSFDAGSGFWKWPYTLKTLMENKGPYEMNLFFSHYHLDHTMGLAQSPFLFDPKNTMNIYGPDFETGVKNVFLENANKPQNPDLTNFYQAALNFNTLAENDKNKTVKLPNGATVKWMFTKHSSEQSVAYRIDYEGRSFVFMTDTDHEFDANDQPVLDADKIEFMRDADMVLYDCHFSDQEFNDAKHFRFFGHSTGEHGVRMCQAANVPLLVTSHHNPNSDDKTLDKLTDQFRRYGASRGVYVIAAQPSLCIDLDLHPAAMIQDIENQQTPEERWKTISDAKPK